MNCLTQKLHAEVNIICYHYCDPEVTSWQAPSLVSSCTPAPLICLELSRRWKKQWRTQQIEKQTRRRVERLKCSNTQWSDCTGSSCYGSLYTCAETVKTQNTSSEIATPKMNWQTLYKLTFYSFNGFMLVRDIVLRRFRKNAYPRFQVYVLFKLLPRGNDAYRILCLLIN